MADRSLLRKLEFVDRRWLFLAMAAAIVIPLLAPLPLPINLTKMVRSLYQAVEELPESSIVLVSVDYDPTAKPELEPFHVALFHHLARRNIRMVIISLWPAGPPLTEQVVAEVGLETTYGKKPGVDFVHLGFKEGRQIVMEDMGRSLRATFPVDSEGTPVKGLPLMNEVDTYRDFAMLINISGGSPGVKEYVQVVQSAYGIKMIGACTAVSGPDYVPYFDSGQLVGLAAGMKGTAEYEQLVGLPGTATSGMVAQSASHLLLILFIVFGNVMYFLGAKEAGLVEAFATWLGIALTLMILSFLYRDNPLYKLAEHLFVGISAGYYIALAYNGTIDPNLVHAVRDGNLWRLGGAVLSVLMFTRFFGKIAWLSRWPLAFVVGMYAGINVGAYGRGDLIIQLESTMLDFLHGGWGGVSNFLLVVGLACSLLYFYFSREHTGALKAASRFGISFLMISFGASFGYTVMSRMSLAIGRARFLMEDAAVAGILIVLISGVLIVWGRRAGSESSG